MLIADRLDPDLIALRDRQPALQDLELTAIAAARDEQKRTLQRTASAPPTDVGIVSLRVPKGDHAILLRLFRPARLAPAAPCLLWMHGGGLILGFAGMEDARLATLASDAGCVIVSVDYRLAPEHPYPAAINDCRDAYGWLLDNAAALDVNPSRVAIGGASAGAGLAAALAHVLKAGGGPQPVLQLLIQPMLDDRNVHPHEQAVEDAFTWTWARNRLAWTAYLGGLEGKPPAAAAAARADDFIGLPPALISIGMLDHFFDESVRYARALTDADIDVEFHTYAGAPHGFEAHLPEAPVSQRCRRQIVEGLRRRLGA